MKPVPKHSKKEGAKAPKSPAKPRQLTVRQERFCEFIASGESQTEAYIRAGWNVARSVAKVKACNLVTKGNVKAKIAALRAPQTEKAMRTKDQNLRYLADVIGTALRDIGPDSPLCVEYVEEVIGGGSRGKLKRGDAPSGNETTGETIMRRKVKKPCPLRAIEIYSRLRGHFEPDRVEVEAGPQTLMSIKERALQVASSLGRDWRKPHN